jgi:thymidylate kinase
VSLTAVLEAPAVRTPAARHVPALSLLWRLAAALDRQGIAACHWKGRRRGRWATGASDLDLLVDRHAAPALAWVLAAFGFKLVEPERHPPPGVQLYLGYDAPSGQLVAVHVHFDIVIGDMGRRPYRIPLTAPFLASAEPGALFPTPAPELELVARVLDGVLRLRPRATRRREDPAWLRERNAELEQIAEEVSLPALARIVETLLPELGPDFFAACWRALRPGCPALERLTVQRRLRHRLAPHAMPRVPLITFGRLRRRLRVAIGLRAASRASLATGGATIALVGADGAGKSTCARALVAWLGTVFHAGQVHLGRPPRGLVTLACGAALKAARWLERRLPRLGAVTALRAHAELARCFCTARDRLRLYRRVRRLAAAGHLIVCDRYPVPESWSLAGPSTHQGVALDARGPVAEWLRRMEAHCYALIAAPDVLFVLRVDPDTAVRRKQDEPSAYVRERARRLWDTRWRTPRSHIVDATRPLAAVEAELRQRVWEAL